MADVLDVIHGNSLLNRNGPGRACGSGSACLGLTGRSSAVRDSLFSLPGRSVSVSRVLGISARHELSAQFGAFVSDRLSLRATPPLSRLEVVPGPIGSFPRLRTQSCQPLPSCSNQPPS